jgi:D-arginine dehydrogenase
MAGAAPLGLRPLRRTAAIVPAPAGYAVERWPMVTDVTETFYFKPESGGLLVSPADATPMAPGDVRPDDLDVARAAARFEEVTTVKVRRIRHRWAGLRTMGPDDTPVVGEAPEAPGFFWFAGLGGYGFQVAPAAATLLAALVTGSSKPRETRHLTAALSPQRTSTMRSI